ncbi:MAG: FKBP-type peptidyl-prolyl cis-trans isomerase, partial [Hyphomicrobiales bacterium]|nr:FKBP-type peptidyl-prolyl cis-trans isomerase [Hyphomicrobiales bacterium]
MRKLLAAFLFAFAAAGAAFAGDLQIKDVEVGDGAEAVAGKEVFVHYTGWLVDGTKFDSSLDRGKPFSFMLGEGDVIPGWDQGVAGMKVGGKRELVIPPELAYGPEGAAGVIPPNATLKFEVSLVDVAEPKFTNVDNNQLAGLLQRGVKIVDIRRPEEWQGTGVIEGSKLITFFDKSGRINPDFMKEFAEIAGPDDEVILICRTGNRTAAVSKFLSERLEYKKINNVKDGITRWI